MKLFSTFVLSFYIALLGISCSEDSAPRDPAPPKAYSFEDLIPVQLGEQTIYLQIAISKKELAQGLMYRSHLEPDHGMLFVFEYPKRATFWMKNTAIPLDLGYFDEKGRLLEIHQLYPFDETPKYSKNDRIKYALEMNQGWFKSHRIKSSDQIDLRAIQHYQRFRAE